MKEDSILGKMYEELREMILGWKEDEFNNLLGYVGDYLEEAGNPQAALCRKRWLIFREKVSHPGRRVIGIEGCPLPENKPHVVSSDRILCFAPGELLLVNWKGHAPRHLNGIFLLTRNTSNTLRDPENQFHKWPPQGETLFPDWWTTQEYEPLLLRAFAGGQ